MTYDFFADEADKLAVLNFIFSETDLRVYDSYSPWGQEIREYQSASEIAAAFDLVNGDKFALTFQLWSPRHRGAPIFERIALDPKRCNGYTFRYCTTGWGLIQLYFGGLKNNELNQSHIGHFNQKGALARESVPTNYDRVDEWNWTEILVTSRKLKYQLHSKMSVRKKHSFGILPGAAILEEQGVTLR